MMGLTDQLAASAIGLTLGWAAWRTLKGPWGGPRWATWVLAGGYLGLAIGALRWGFWGQIL